MARAEHFFAVLDVPRERRHRTRGDTCTFPESLCGLTRGCSPEDFVAGSFEALSHGRKGARLARARNSDDKVQGMARTEQTLGDFGLSRCETEPSGKLGVPDRRSRLLMADCRPAPFRQAVGEVRETALVFDDTACRPNRLPGTGNEREGDGALVQKHLVNCAVQD